MLTKTQLTAQELREWLGLVEELTERYARNTPEDDAKFMAIHRLVGDVERWKKMMRIGPPEGGMWRVSEEIQGYKYDGEG